MTRGQRTFTVLLCGPRDFMGKIRPLVGSEKEVHLQFSAVSRFLTGRSMFHPPSLAVVHVDEDDSHLYESLREFVLHNPQTPLIAVSSAGNHRSAVDLVKLGVTEYFQFPREKEALQATIASSLAAWREKRQRERFAGDQKRSYDFSTILGSSDAIARTIALAHRVIQNTSMTVLITGETGTGKELLARAIHYNGRTKESPFVDIICSALPETLLESELFGYEKGAFTDARERKQGLFEIAGDGSIFLDEIGDISPAIQSKLLKVIENRTMRRLGGLRDIPVRARIIAATSADLEAKMRAGEFRKDLFHRLKILPLTLPPLRERRDDIPLLIGGFLKTFNATYERSIKGVTPTALELMMNYEWEGNVRELKHALERAVLLADGDWITDKELDLAPRKQKPGGRQLPVDVPLHIRPGIDDALMLMVPLHQASMADVQHLLVRKVLDHVGGNKMRASKILKISRPRLDRILRNGGDD